MDEDVTAVVREMAEDCVPEIRATIIRLIGLTNVDLSAVPQEMRCEVSFKMATISTTETSKNLPILRASLDLGLAKGVAEASVYGGARLNLSNMGLAVTIFLVRSITNVNLVLEGLIYDFSDGVMGRDFFYVVADTAFILSNSNTNGND